jgi:hypothetical protein
MVKKRGHILPERLIGFARHQIEFIQGKPSTSIVAMNVRKRYVMRFEHTAEFPDGNTE